MMNIETDLREEQIVYQALQKRMDFFDDLKESADSLVEESGRILELTEGFKASLEAGRASLERDFNAEEVEMNLGDDDFANEFMQNLYDALQELSNKALEVGDACRVRKRALDDVLSGINRLDMDQPAEGTDDGSA